jgi:Leucine-rich repeat (LRR) protein
MINADSRWITLAVIVFLATALTNAAAPVKELTISEKNAELLQHIESYPDLEVLSISCLESLQSLPESIGKLTRLRELIIDNGNGCSMNPVLPESIGNLRSLEKLVLYGAQDPRDPGPQPAERHKFPSSMSQLKNLTHLDLGRNGLEEIPAFVKDLPRLRELGFDWNMKLKRVPTFLVDLPNLTTLRLNADDLEDLPDFLSTLPKLTRITLGNNCKIIQNEAKMRSLRKRFPKVTFDFEDEYDCPAK